MIIHSVSKNGEFHKLCREILADIPEFGHSGTLVAISPEAGWREADLHIWDFQPNLDLPKRLTWNPLRHLFLVDRKDLPTFRQRTGVGDPYAPI